MLSILKCIYAAGSIPEAFLKLANVASAATDSEFHQRLNGCLQMTAHKSERLTIRQWLATHARDKPVHYTDIAEALGRDPASVSASLSIERRQARRDERPPYF
ncbi:MAG: hypothetical protein DRO93_10610, partial [Candidatus Thorarchaeota archaeon]